MPSARHRLDAARRAREAFFAQRDSGGRFVGIRGRSARPPRVRRHTKARHRVRTRSRHGQRPGRRRPGREFRAGRVRRRILVARRAGAHKPYAQPPDRCAGVRAPLRSTSRRVRRRRAGNRGSARARLVARARPATSASASANVRSTIGPTFPSACAPTAKIARAGRCANSGAATVPAKSTSTSKSRDASALATAASCATGSSTVDGASTFAASLTSADAGPKVAVARSKPSRGRPESASIATFAPVSANADGKSTITRNRSPALRIGQPLGTDGAKAPAHSAAYRVPNSRPATESMRMTAIAILRSAS